MTTTPNLLIDHIAANQAQKEVTARPRQLQRRA